MGCNCGGRTRPPATVYRLTMPNGAVHGYPTLYGAEAANDRMGGGTISITTDPAPRYTLPR